jgi:hypothetical protein
LFPQAPVVDFCCPRTVCTCGARLKVYKTQTKRVLSLAGTFICRQSLRRCDACGQIFDDPALRRWVAHRCNTAWDVVVFVGRRLFEGCRRIGQLRAELLARDVCLSQSQIAKLGRKFIRYLALAHRQAIPRIQQAMHRGGGYILHLDALHQEDAPALMCGMDGIRRIVLANLKVPSENAEQIIPFLEQLKNSYGEPLACVHDMGTGICKAVAAVFVGTRDFICHFHFLRDVGKDLLEPAYRKLRNCLRQHAISTQLSALARHARHGLEDRIQAASALAAAIAGATPTADPTLMPRVAAYALALWCLQAKHSGDGYGFPFDRPLLKLAERLLSLIDWLPRIFKCLPGEKRAFIQLSQKVIDVVSDPVLEQSVEELTWRCQLFDQLRSHMRIAVAGGPNGLNDDGSPASMNRIRHGVLKFRSELESQPKLATDPLCCKMAEQIDKYAEKLFAEPIQVQTPSGPVTVYPQRTNNLLEQLFRTVRRGHRQRTGDNSMRRRLQTMPADTPLVKNLANPEYMKILLNGKLNLEELFAELEINAAANDWLPDADADRILPGFKQLARMPNLPDRITQMAEAAPMA